MTKRTTHGGYTGHIQSIAGVRYFITEKEFKHKGITEKYPILFKEIPGTDKFFVLPLPVTEKIRVYQIYLNT